MPEPHPSPSTQGDLDRAQLTVLSDSTDAVILLACDDESAESHPQKIQVSTTVLSIASKPFKALFSKNFAEGQIDPAATTPRVIKIHDNSEALLNLCKLLHFQSLTTAESFGDSDACDLLPENLLTLGVVADKWGCTEALRLQSNSLLTNINEKWFERFDYDVRWEEEMDDGEKTDVRDIVLTDLLIAAYLLDQPSHFRRFTREFLLWVPSGRKTEAADKRKTYLPDTFSYTIRSQQDMVLLKIVHQTELLFSEFVTKCTKLKQMDVLSKFMECNTSRLPGLSDPNTAEWQGFLSVKDQIKMFSSIKFPPVRQPKTKYCLCDLIPKPADLSQAGLAGFKKFSVGTEEQPSYHHSSCLHVPAELFKDKENILPTYSSLDEKIDHYIKNFCVGICLDCLRQRTCREKHPAPWGQADDWSDDPEWIPRWWDACW